MKKCGLWLTQMAVVVTLASVLGLGWNQLSPRGIPLIGQWETSVGVVSADVSDAELSRTVQTVIEAESLWRGGAKFLDARAVEQFSEGRIQGAMGFSVYDFDALVFDFLDNVPPETPLITYCSGRLCDESHQLATLLEEAGYSNVRVFADGFPAWIDSGLPVEGGK